MRSGSTLVSACHYSPDKQVRFMHDRCRPLRKSVANMSEDTNLTNVVFKNPVNVKLHVAVAVSS